ncbi:MAG: hypothetical protein M3O90_00520 [Actinomycetota bacterium]|nr:hypothetical protein [Actinomycetota bacterium]
MARARRSREDDEEREGEEEEGPRTIPEAERPLDSGTVSALKQADPQTRARTLLRLQRLHGNATVQRVIRSLQVTDAGADARVQAIGDRAEEPAASGGLDKALLYREAIEAELEHAPLASKSERELVQDNVNTIGQIFANYQAALHLFESAVRSGLGEAVPRELAKEVLREAARSVFEPVLAAVSGTVAGLDDAAAAGMGAVGDVPMEETKESGQSAPAHSLRNLVIAERRRIAAAQTGLIKRQIHFLKVTESKAGDSDYRDKLAAAADDLNEKESTTHSANSIFKAILERWDALSRNPPSIRVVLDADWKVVRAHIRAPNGSKLASQLLQDSSGWFNLNDLHVARHVEWEPAELAMCEARLDPDGRIKALNRNDKARPHFDDFQKRLRTEGLPHTKVLSGD